MLRPVICQGRRISPEELEWLRGWIVTHGDWSRKRLARELCVLWDWRNGVGRLKDFAARSFLCKLAERGLIELPPVREYKRSGAQTLGWVKGDFEHTPEPLCAELKQTTACTARLGGSRQRNHECRPAGRLLGRYG